MIAVIVIKSEQHQFFAQLTIIYVQPQIRRNTAKYQEKVSHIYIYICTMNQNKEKSNISIEFWLLVIQFF